MSELTECRKAQDRFFAEDPHSPLLPDQKRKHPHLKYFPEDPSYRFIVELKGFPEGERDVIQMATSTGDVRPIIRWGQFEFNVGGQTVNLTAYKSQEDDELFLPFGDATNGVESYGAGRYLEPALTGDGKYVLDFNYAYNPYCAYNPRWICPIPPQENRLQVSIKAGEKLYPGSESH